MKKYDNKAKELYEQALNAGLKDVAEEIKKKYIVSKEITQPIKKWFEEWFSQSHFISVLLQARNNMKETFPLYANGRLYQQAREELATKCRKDIGVENILLNSNDETKDRYTAWKIAKWNYDALNKYTKDKLLEYGFKQSNLNDMVVNTNNMNKFAVVYCPTNNEQSFDTLKLMDLFQWAYNNRTSQKYEGMMVWMKD